MATKMCRLCLSNDRLIHMFDSRLNSQQQLLNCILLGTGVDIRQDDAISKHVCHNCCIISVKLFKYRQNALACDRALKEYVVQEVEQQPFNKEEIVEMNRSLVEGLCKLDSNMTIHDDAPLTKLKSAKGSSAVHPSVRKLFRNFSKVIIPNEVLPFDIDPEVVLEKDSDCDVRVHPVDSVTEDDDVEVETDLEAIGRLQQTCPALNIVRIQADKGGGEDTATAQLSTGRKRMLGSREEEVVQTKIQRVSSDDAPPSEPTAILESNNSANGGGEAENLSSSTSKDSEVCLCEYCGRIYDYPDELRLHEDRMHPACYVCKQKQKSPATLVAHLSDVCYKKIEANPPKLQLTRVEDVPELRERYKDALAYVPEEEEEEEETPLAIVSTWNMTDVYAKETPGERHYLQGVFNKHKGYDSKSKYTRMQLSDIKIRYDAKNRIIIENIYPDLKVFKVPLNLKVSSTVTANISTAPKVKIDSVKMIWDPTKAIDLKPKYRQFQSYLVGGNKVGVSNLIVPEGMRENVPSIVVLQSAASIGQATRMHYPAPNVTVRKTTSPSGPQFTAKSAVRKVYKPVIKTVQNGSLMSGVNVRQLYSQPSAISSPAQNEPVMKIVVSASQVNQTAEVRVLSPNVAATTPPAQEKQTQKKPGQSLLRVRAPWEINNSQL